MSKIQVIVPYGAMGSAVVRDRVETMLRTLAEIAKAEPGQWATKYGTCFENDTFMMHHYCWCEGKDCPWCVGCSCTHSYAIDGVEVDDKTYYDRRMEYMKWPPSKVKARRSSGKEPRFVSKVVKECAFCAGGARRAPNFLFKKTNFKVWWYKYIGRSMEFQVGNGPVANDSPENVMSLADQLKMELACLHSMGCVVK